MKLLSISGGGTKIAGLLGQAEVVMTEKGYRPDIIAGISAGAILAVPLALGKFKECRELVLSMNLQTIFSRPPVKPNGKIKTLNALWRLIKGDHYLSRMDNLEKGLRRVVTRDDWRKYVVGKYPHCTVVSVDFKTGGRLVSPLRHLMYAEFIDAVLASASIPVFTPGIIDKYQFTDDSLAQLFDGGVRHHSPAVPVIEYYKSITESCILYSRPRDYRILHTDWRPKNMLAVLDRYIEITNTEISKRDEQREAELIRDKGIHHHGTLYLPGIMEGYYDTDPDRVKQLYLAGREEARQNFLP